MRAWQRARAFAVVSGALAGAFAVMPRAVAAPAAVDAKSDEARAAFIRGNTAYNLGKYNEAIAAFEQAYGLSRHPEILFNLGL
jgi:tetratricopeptide (TPR) repeat protein